MVKRYRIKYWWMKIGKLDLRSIIEISKTGRRNGHEISFFTDGRKNWEFRCKNDRLNGVQKFWLISSKNYIFDKYKKGTPQGIRIYFK